MTFTSCVYESPSVLSDPTQTSEPTLELSTAPVQIITTTLSAFPDTPQSTHVKTPFSGQMVTMGNPILVEEGAFTVRLVDGFEEQHQYSWASITDGHAGFYMTLYRIPTVHVTVSLEELLYSYIETVEKPDWPFQLSDPYTFVVGDLEGIAIDYSSERPLIGNGTFTAMKRNDWDFFITNGRSNEANRADRWEEEGREFFQLILEGIHFFEVPDPTYPCVVSSDGSYGYTANRPIQIGGRGNEFSLRKQAFLETISGPQGERVDYQFLGSEDVETSTWGVYLYNLSYEGLSTPKLIYFSMDSFEDPRVPVGFSCNSDFPFASWPLENVVSP